MNCRVCGSELPDGALFCGACGSSVTATRVRPPTVADPRPSDTSIVEPLPKPAVAGRFPGQDPEALDEVEPLEAAAPVVQPEASDGDGRDEPSEPSDPAEQHASFTFTFSTGETAVVAGSGLLGRRPVEQPGEVFDQLVQITDLDRSVSKTHLEFGFEGDELWLCDRYSGNGTIARPPGGVARQFEPGHRYRVARGTRIEIGDQYFDVS